MKKIAPFFILLSILLITGCNETPKIVSTEVVHPEWSKDAVIYEVNIRQFSPEGTFNSFTSHIPRLKELGVDILWLMPVHPIGIKNRKGELGSYYSVKDYRDVNPEFGTMDDFKNMVKMAHSLDMRVIIDWVPNHSSWDNALLEEHPEWYALDSTGNMYSPYDWTDVVQFDYSKQGLKDYMIETFVFWLNETDLDGFRMDVAHQVPVEFWNEVRIPLLEAKPDVFLLAEAEIRELHEKAFDMTYAWEFHHTMNEIAQGKKTVSDIVEYLDRSEIDYNPNDMRMYFTSNHDENSWNGTVWERMGDATEVMAVLSYTLPGMPLIYNGQEAGLAHRLEFFVKDSIPWIEHPFNQLYTSLNKLKKQNQALWNPGFGGSIELIINDFNDQVLSFKRMKDDNEVIVVLNLSDEALTVSLETDEDLSTYKNFKTGESVSFAQQKIELPVWGYTVIYK